MSYHGPIKYPIVFFTLLIYCFWMLRKKYPKAQALVISIILVGAIFIGVAVVLGHLMIHIKVGSAGF